MSVTAPPREFLHPIPLSKPEEKDFASFPFFEFEKIPSIYNRKVDRTDKCSKLHRAKKRRTSGKEEKEIPSKSHAINSIERYKNISIARKIGQNTIKDSSRAK